MHSTLTGHFKILELICNPRESKVHVLFQLTHMKVTKKTRKRKQVSIAKLAAFKQLTELQQLRIAIKDRQISCTTTSCRVTERG